jgi:hypothetical protein
MINHDRLSKELVTTHFIEFLELFYPQVASWIDPKSIIFLDKEIFTDVTSGERHEVDVVAKVRFRGQPAFFLVHIETQDRSEAAFSERMFHYFARLHAKYRLPIYPIAVISHGKPRSESDAYTVKFPDGEVLRFRFRVIYLKQLNWRQFLRHRNPVAIALMARMGFKPEERAQVKFECLRLLATFKLNKARQRLISGFVDTYLRLNAKEELQFQKKIAKLTRDKRQKVMELTTSWKEEGLKEGLEKGRKQGEEIVVLRQLKRRCGPFSPNIEKTVRSLPISKLDDLAEALLDFSSPADLRNWLRKQ